MLSMTMFSACDSGISGNGFENNPPETELSVQDESLLDNLSEEDRLVSSVRITWVGDDTDGFVSGYEIRFYDIDTSSPEDAEWNFTTSTDSTILLPVRQGQRTSNVAFEVRAIDNDDARDPSPAKTVFPIKNSPPTLRLSPFDLPPDTTFTVVSFAWSADDPDGIENLASVSVSLNDSTQFVDLDPDVDFITLLADQDAVAAGDDITEARVFIGRGLQSTSIRVPGFRMDQENTFYVRTTDRADTTSVIDRFTWHVKRNSSNVLYVNDYRLSTNTTVLSYHMDILRSYLPEGTAVDIWDITTPYTTGSSGTVPRSDLLPSSAEPTLRLTLSLFDHIYWVSNSTTSNAQSDNMAFVAPVLADFFADGGTMMVHSPVAVPFGVTEFDDNAAVLLLPISEPLVVPDSVRRLELPFDAPVTPTAAGQTLGLPTLFSDRFFINLRPYSVNTENIISVYEADFLYRTTTGGRGDWPEPRTVASLSSDGRIGLFAPPLVNDQTGEVQFLGENDSDETAREAVHRMLDALDFPSR